MLEDCTLCDQKEDPRWGLIVDGERRPLCDGCAPEPGDKKGTKRVADLCRAKPIDTAAKETAIRVRMNDLRDQLRDAQAELDALHGGPTGPLRWGERVELTRTYDVHDAEPLGSQGKVDYVWPDGQVCVAFDRGSRGAYWPRDLKRVPAKATSTGAK